jgi:hypothetical protein
VAGAGHQQLLGVQPRPDPGSLGGRILEVGVGAAHHHQCWRGHLTQPSLYKHIASLDALRGEVSAFALRELGEAMTAAVLGKAGSDALLALAVSYRDYARRHPGRYAATVTAPAGDQVAQQQAAAAVLKVVEAVLAGYGLTGDDAVHATRALRAAVHGFVHLEANHGFELPTDVDRSYHRLIEGLDATMSTWATEQAAR